MSSTLSYGNVYFNCTHPMGVPNCPFHSKDPKAPLMDCKYGLVWKIGGRIKRLESLRDNLMNDKIANILKLTFVFVIITELITIIPAVIKLIEYYSQ